MKRLAAILLLFPALAWGWEIDRDAGRDRILRTDSGVVLVLKWGDTNLCDQGRWAFTAERPGDDKVWGCYRRSSNEAGNKVHLWLDDSPDEYDIPYELFSPIRDS